MRHNFTVRRSNIAEYYDVIYDYIPDRPEVSEFINHPRKLRTINRSADPYYAQPLEIFHEPTLPFY